MSCTSPLQAYRDDKGLIHFTDLKGGDYLELPCGRCISCRLEKSRQWAMRCVHEASLHKENCFLTLTYNNENLPSNCSLDKSHFTKFIKRLRSRLDRKIRYFMCGEYGDINKRPHYHALLFGYEPDDKQYLFTTKSGSNIYTSEFVSDVWNLGFITIGELTFESASYTARYCLKKITGPLADTIDKNTGLRPYERVNEKDGRIVEVLPEYATMSRNPGIAYNFINRYTSDCYPKDFIHINGNRSGLPRYYDEQLKKINIDLYDEVKQKRIVSAYESNENSVNRLRQKAIINKRKVNKFKRIL